MVPTVATALFTLFSLYILKLSVQFARNLKAAKESGITYTIVPVFLVNRLYQVSCIFIIPLMRKLPKSWTEPWFDLTLEWGWIRRYEPFARFGSDTFITVSPEQNVLYTADADVVNQITTRRSDFPKALEVYESLKIYGNNVVTSEGQLWRHHRKIVGPPFTEKNNHLVWSETLTQCQAMVDSWLGGRKDRSGTIYTIAEDAMRLSLHVISKAGFGVSLHWPGSEMPQANGALKSKDDRSDSSFETSADHTMSYTDALGSLLHNILTMLILPPFLLSKPCSLSCSNSPADSTSYRVFTISVYQKYLHILCGMGKIHERDVPIEKN